LPWLAQNLLWVISTFLRLVVVITVQMGPVVRHLTLMEHLVLSGAQAAHHPALTELREAVSVVMEEAAARRVRMELLEVLGTDSEVIKMGSVMAVVVLLPARTGLLVEAKTASVAA
jgi:Holliday junction resolvasome RuvABC endonuclease subunit